MSEDLIMVFSEDQGLWIELSKQYEKINMVHEQLNIYLNEILRLRKLLAEARQRIDDLESKIRDGK